MCLRVPEAGGLELTEVGACEGLGVKGLVQAFLLSSWVGICSLCLQVLLALRTTSLCPNISVHKDTVVSGQGIYLILP